jgi:predicted RNase H-like HicB family nuclease
MKVLESTFMPNHQLIFMRFTIKLEESEEGGYTAQCLEIPAAISEGDTKEEALENIKEAIQLILEVTRNRLRFWAKLPQWRSQLAKLP